MVFLFFQSIPAMKEEVSSADEAQAAKRPCLPSSSAPPAESMMAPPAPSSTLVAAQEHPGLGPLPTPELLSQPTTAPQEGPAPTSGNQMDAETPMDTSSPLAAALSESFLGSDPTLTPQSTPFQATLNSDPLLSAQSPPHPQHHMSEGYTPSSGYVSYMETLLHSHFPQDDGSSSLY